MSRANPRFRRANQPLPVPTTNVYEAIVMGQVDAQQTRSTLYYTDSVAVGTNVPTGILALNAAVTAGAASWAPITTADWTFQGVITRSITSPTYLSQERLLVSPVPGTVAGSYIGTVPCATIDRYTAFRGQAGRGRLSSPPVPASFVATEPSLLNATALPLYQTWATANLLTPITSGGITFTPVLVSRGLRTQTPKVIGAAPLVQCYVNPIIGTCRRRRLDRGI